MLQQGEHEQKNRMGESHGCVKNRKQTILMGLKAEEQLVTDSGASNRYS